MIAHLIRWSVRNRFFVLIGVLALIGVGVWAVRSTAIDALPDLSDTPVIIRTSYPGQAPQIAENKVRSEERREGKESVVTCRSRWTQYHEKKKQNTTKRT